MYNYGIQSTDDNDRKLIHEVRQILQIVRAFVNSDKCLINSIDYTYEEMLINDLNTIPEQYDSKLLEILTVVKIFIKNIDFVRISEELDNLKGNNFRLTVDLYSNFEKMINKLGINKKDKARIINIVLKFKPLFTCIDKLLYDPIALVKQIGNMKNNELNNLFEY